MGKGARSREHICWGRTCCPDAGMWSAGSQYLPALAASGSAAESDTARNLTLSGAVLGWNLGAKQGKLPRFRCLIPLMDNHLMDNTCTWPAYMAVQLFLTSDSILCLPKADPSVGPTVGLLPSGDLFWNTGKWRITLLT